MSIEIMESGQNIEKGYVEYLKEGEYKIEKLPDNIKCVIKIGTDYVVEIKKFIGIKKVNCCIINNNIIIRKKEGENLNGYTDNIKKAVRITIKNNMLQKLEEDINVVDLKIIKKIRKGEKEALIILAKKARKCAGN